MRKDVNNAAEPCNCTVNFTLDNAFKVTAATSDDTVGLNWLK